MFEALVLAGFLKGSNRLNKGARNHRLASLHAFGLTHCLFCKKNLPPPGGLEPPTFRLTAERASRLRHGGIYQHQFYDTISETLFPILLFRKLRSYALVILNIKLKLQNEIGKHH